MIFKIEMGEKVKDSVTGFCGVVTARTEYMTGCRQYAVTPKVGKGNEARDGQWFDEDRLLKKQAKNKNLGGPQRNAPPLR